MYKFSRITSTISRLFKFANFAIWYLYYNTIQDKCSCCTYFRGFKNLRKYITARKYVCLQYGIMYYVKRAHHSSVEGGPDVVLELVLGVGVGEACLELGQPHQHLLCRETSCTGQTTALYIVVHLANIILSTHFLLIYY